MANEPDGVGPGQPSSTYSELEKRLATLKGEGGRSTPTYESLEERHQALKGPPSKPVSTQDLLRRFEHLTGEKAIANGRAVVEAQVSQSPDSGQKHAINYLIAATDEGFDVDLDEIEMLMAQVGDTEQADMSHHTLAGEPGLAPPTTSTGLTEAERLMVEMQDQLTLSKKHEGSIAFSGFKDDAYADESDDVQRIILAAKERALLDAKYEKAKPTETAASSTCSGSSEELSTSDDDY